MPSNLPFGYPRRHRGERFTLAPLAVRNGWLDPRGEFHEIGGSGQHCDWCERNTRVNCRTLLDPQPGFCDRDQEGWFRLANGKWIIAVPSKMSKRQYDFIVGWHLHNQRDMREFNRIVDACWESHPKL